MRLEVTRKSDLAVRLLRVLADRGSKCKGPELAAAVESTPGFIAQVATPLVRRGWVRSEPGPSGGYSLTISLDDVSVLEVIEAIEGPTETGRCVVADRPCAEQGSCGVHVPWARARKRLVVELGKVTVAEAALTGRGAS